MNKDLFHRLLDYYHIDENGYQKLIAPVDETNFALGHHFDRIEEAIAILNEAINKNEKIFIYGDYDCDGVMGTSILVKMLLYKNVRASYYLPNRYVDGYGLTLNKAQECIDNHVGLVITVDNGVSAFEPIKLLKDNGIKVLVLDHHTIQDEVPVADVILHPQYAHFGDTPSSGGFVAFMFSIAFLGYFDKYLANLASISLISDMMPLKDYNRNLLRLCFDNYQDGEFYTIDSLKELEPFNETTIGMKIAPKINAIGRMIDGNEINDLVAFLTDDNKNKLLHYIEWINSVNEERKILSKQVSENLNDYFNDQKGIVYLASIKEGLLGLIANSLVNKYHVPVIVLALDKNGDCYKGSCRAPEGFNVVTAFDSLSKYLTAYGGHAMAGGCTLRKDDFMNFKIDFLDYCESHPIEHVEKPAIDFSLTEVNLDNLKLIESFSPFGESHPRPLLKIQNLYIPSLQFSRSGEHLLMPLGQNSKLTGFNISKESLAGYKYLDVTGSLRLGTFKNFSYSEFLIDNIEKHN